MVKLSIFFSVFYIFLYLLNIFTIRILKYLSTHFKPGLHIQCFCFLLVLDFHHMIQSLDIPLDSRCYYITVTIEVILNFKIIFPPLKIILSWCSTEFDGLTLFHNYNWTLYLRHNSSQTSYCWKRNYRCEEGNILSQFSNRQLKTDILNMIWW